MSEKIGSVKAELKSLDMYKMKYEEKPTPALERIIKKQQERVLKAVLQENEKKKISLKPSKMDMPVETELKPIPEMPTGAVYKLTPSEMPALEVLEMKATKSRSDLPRLRKKLIEDIKRLNMVVGIDMRKIGRMMKQVETGRETTVMKLVEELKPLEAEYDKKQAKKMKK
jgi:phosphopantetheinyl transferase (holo-ACP synthase)